MKSRLTKAAMVAGVLLTSLTTTARADDLSRSDKLRVLYSNQFAFDRRGVPLITIRIAEGGNSTVIESKSPVRVFPDGEDGSEVVGGKRWKVSLRSSTPAVLEHFVVLDRAPTTELAQLRSGMSAWRSRGARCRLIEVGTVFGVKGKVFDNRAIILADGPYASRRAALKAAEAFHRKHGLAKVRTVSQLRKRPEGQFEARDQESAARVRARDAIWFAPARGARLTVRTGAGKPRSYWGQIYVTVDRNGALAVVNAAPADRLLAGLVPSEIFPTAPRAALRAQSVAARGELLVKIGTRHLVDPYLICATQHCQVYKGASQEHPRATEAIAATRGMILSRPDGRLVDAVYSASCGGHTEHNNNAWPVKPDPSLRGHLDGVGSEFSGGITEHNIERWLSTRPRTWCGQSRYNKKKYRWVSKISSRQINRMVRHLGTGKVKEVKVLARGVSGRAKLIEVVGDLGARKVRGELTIRRLFGGLRSSMFVVKPLAADAAGHPAAFFFHGGGWGHGVGMCQTGAIGMASGGKRYKEILRHYYPGSEIKPLY